MIVRVLELVIRGRRFIWALVALAKDCTIEIEREAVSVPANRDTPAA